MCVFVAPPVVILSSMPMGSTRQRILSRHFKLPPSPQIYLLLSYDLAEVIGGLYDLVPQHLKAHGDTDEANLGYLAKVTIQILSCFVFQLCSEYYLNSLMTSTLTHELFHRMLPNYQVFGGFPDTFVIYL